MTWMAKSAHHDPNGGVLVTDAIGIALEIAEKASATVLALDPYDQPISWKSRYAMRESRTELMARDGEPALRRLYVPASEQTGCVRSELDSTA